MAILSCHVSIKLPPKISDGQVISMGRLPCVGVLRNQDKLPRNREEADLFFCSVTPLQKCETRTKGNDLVRFYLWNAARTAIQHNPAIRALYRRLRAKGKRGDVAFGHCMRKLLHLVYAVWKTDRPFDKEHFPWEGSSDTQPSATTPPSADAGTTPSANEEAVGHKRDLPAAE